MAQPAMVQVAHELRQTDISSLYAAVGEGQVAAQSVVQRLVEAFGGEEGAAEDLAESATPTRQIRGRARPAGDPGVVVKGASDVWVKLARCCTPVPGDSIIGFVTRGDGVSVHRTDCSTSATARAAPNGRGRVGADGQQHVPGATSRSRRSTGPGCCPTSRGCCPTST